MNAYSDNATVDPAVKADLDNLEKQVKVYQQESKYIEAIGILEELLKVKKIHYGVNSP